MKILLLEPFFTASHKSWALSYQESSAHQVELLTLPGRYWKWRMHGAAVSLARMYEEKQCEADLILATDMLDLSTFLALSRKYTAHIPTAIYFHENQLTYPWSPTDQDVQKGRDNHYSFINYTSALAADRVYFNSDYHLNSFIGELPKMLKQFPDHNELGSAQSIREKSEVLPLMMDLKRFDAHKPDDIELQEKQVPLLLWNHRWEYDKNPEAFFEMLFQLAEEGLAFEVAVLGEQYKKQPAIFKTAQEKLGDRIVQFGYAEDFKTYAQWLWRSDILAVTSNQDFFGGSVVEAMYCDCFPLLPKRLAYPEHIPVSDQNLFYYSDEDELYKRLKWLVVHWKQLRLIKTQQYVSRYDKRAMAPYYDQILSDQYAANAL